MAIVYRAVLENRRPQGDEVNCASCQHLGEFSGEQQRGFCMERRNMVSTWHPARCTGFKPSTGPRRTEVKWKGATYGTQAGDRSTDGDST